MKPIRTRDELIAMAVAHAPTKACATAIIRTDGATVCGGFVSPTGLQGWIISVQARFGSRWIIAIYVDENKRCYKIRYLKRVPWERWLGKSTGKPGLLHGDRPIENAFKQMQQRRKHEKSAAQNHEDRRRAEVHDGKLRLQDEPCHRLQLDIERSSE